MAKTDKQVQARILRDGAIDGVDYKINQVVQFSPDQAAALLADSAADPSPEAVAYAVKLGATVVTHSK